MASYGPVDGGRAIYCPRHKQPGLVDVVNRVCSFDGCRKRPHYNFAARGACGAVPTGRRVW